MKRINARTVICLFLAVILMAGTLIYIYNFFIEGSTWVSFPSNRHLYTDGKLNSGKVMDRHGTILADCNPGAVIYNKNSSIRKSTLHTVGDQEGRIGVGALSRFSGKLTGYNFITGAKPVFSGERQLYLTLDADVCQTAYQALNGKNGTVGVYNYKTGEIICLVSTPTFDPTKPPEIKEGDTSYNGIYTNHLLSATFIPGSTFKLVTAAAALENIPDIENRQFQCQGSTVIDGMTITCPSAHGSLTLGDALTVSCNCTFGKLASELGSKTMDHYVKKTGLTRSYSVNGIQTAPSTFNFDTGSAGELAWSGIGQGKDLVNPCAMMIYSGSIANGGPAAIPQIISKVTTEEGLRTSLYITHKTGKLIEKETASTLATMMRNNVLNNYGQKNFPNLTLCAKSGTSQSDSSGQTHAWFTGFLQDDSHPYAFIVYVENGGSGSKTAGKIANKVLQTAIENNH